MSDKPKYPAACAFHPTTRVVEAERYARLLEVLVEVARLWPRVKDAPADVVLARCEAISASVATVLYQIHEETADRTESADSGSSPPPTTSSVAGITAVTGGERPACSRCGGTLGCGALCITTDVSSEGKENGR